MHVRLVPRPQVRKDDRDGFAVEGLRSIECASVGATLKHAARALALRHTRSHKLNNYSSRSHCIMTMVFASRERGGQGGADGGVRRCGVRGIRRRCHGHTEERRAFGFTWGRGGWVKEASRRE
eukprot:363951-Chlamydomonas_euryale.AAC.2